MRRKIDYTERNRCYANSEYDLQRLVGKRYLGMDYIASDVDKRIYKDRDSYEVFLHWEGYIMSFIAPGAESIPYLLEMNKYIGCKLEDWDSMPNHAFQTFMLFFEGTENGIVFDTVRYVKWEVTDKDILMSIRPILDRGNKIRPIDYSLRNKWYSNNEYDLQRLIGKKYLGFDYKVSDADKRMFENIEAYEVFLKWEGLVMSFVAPGAYDLPLRLNEYIGCRLRDWDAIPNHACQMFILIFGGAEEEVVFNTFRYLRWEVVG